MENCIFCKIIKKEIPSNILYESDQIIAFPDIHPSAEHHILLVPKQHIASISDLDGHGDLLSEIYKVAVKLAKENNFDSIFRVVVNAGLAQKIPHLHFHLLGGHWKRKV